VDAARTRWRERLLLSLSPIGQLLRHLASELLRVCHHPIQRLEQRLQIF
jgi:hypothetical protein